MEWLICQLHWAILRFCQLLAQVGRAGRNNVGTVSSVLLNSYLRLAHRILFLLSLYVIARAALCFGYHSEL